MTPPGPVTPDSWGRIRDAAIRAVTPCLHRFDPFPGEEFGDPCLRVRGHAGDHMAAFARADFADAAIAAVRPLIEAEAGNRIADAIEAARVEYVKNLRAAAGLGDAVPLPANADAYAGGLRRGKEIAQGETP